MKKILIPTLLFSLIANAQQVKVYIYTSGTPTSVTVTPAPMKYNKTSVFMLSLDDDNKEGWDVFKNSQKYSYTDGAGKPINYSIEYALNSRNSYNNNLLLEDGYTTAMTLGQLSEVMKHRCTFSNHGAFHFPCSVKNQPGWENAGCFDYTTNIVWNEQYFHRKMGELGIPLSGRIWTNPSDDTGYYKKADSLGYLAASSQGTTDNNYITPGGSNDIQAGGPVTIPTINGGFKLYRRDFSDAWEIDYNARIKGYINTLITSANTSTRKLYRIGSHLNANAILYIDTAFQQIQSTSNDNTWVTTTQEFEEYFEVIRTSWTTKTQSTNGNVTVLTIDFSNAPDKERFRDMSLQVSVAGATFQKAFVSGVDDYSYNIASGLINFYSEKRNGYARPYGSNRITGQLPLTSDMIVVSGYPITAKEDYWLDGSANNFDLGSGTYATDTVDVSIEFDPYKKRKTKITSFQFWDANGDAINNPAVFYGVKYYGGADVQLATFTGDQFNAWVTANVSDTSTFSRIFMRKVYVNNGSYSRTVPGKIKVFGSYNDDTIYHAAFVPNYTRSKFKQMAGGNTYWSKIADPSTSPDWQRSILYPYNVKTSRDRFYFDLCQHFFTGDSTWFQYYDSTFKWIHDSGVDINISIKSMPQHWVTANYPATINGQSIYPDWNSSCLNVLVPAPWGSNWQDPNSYSKVAEYCFQIAARYGSNPNISESFRKSKQPPFAFQHKDAAVWGLGYVKYFSAGNENDKSWIGNYKWLNQNGAELMAQMSACYDGNKGAMGAGIGIKAADPTMIVLPPAYTTAGARDDILRMGRQWVIANRGYRADGVTPDWPFDEMDFHNYSSDAGGQHQQSTGKSHEQSVAFGEVDTVLKFAGAYMNNMKANITETGWDTKDTTIGGVRQGTVQNAALDIIGKSVFQVQSDWIDRMMLASWARGINWIDFYELFDNDDVNAYLTLYSSSGLFFSQNQGYWSGVYNAPTNKPSGATLVQLRKILDNYIVDSLTIRSSDSAWIIKSHYLDSVKYVVWVGTQKNATASVTLPIAQGVKYSLDYNSENYSSSSFNTGTDYTFTATEQPVIILVGQEGTGGGGGGGGSSHPVIRIRGKARPVNQ